jgi:L-lactate utilization protein LutB
MIREYETTLRKAGLYEQYEKSMIKGGLKAFLQDMEEYFLEQINQTDTFVTEQGDVEDWSNNNLKVKEKALENLQEFLTHAKKHLKD